MPLTVQELSVRESFVPRPGFGFLDIDIEALELCTLAQVEIWTLGDDTKANQMNTPGFDPHSVTGATQMQVPYEDFKHKAKVLGLPEYANERNLAKVTNFGKPGGMADETLISFARTGYGIRLGATPECPRPSREMQVAEAVRLGQAWKRANPHDGNYLHYIKTKCRRPHGLFDVVIGHPSIGTVIWRKKASYCAACNTPFQGLGALAAGEITLDVQLACHGLGPGGKRNPLYGSRLVQHAYDQWVTETPVERITEAAAELERIVTESGARKVPDVRLHGEAVAIARWAKKAKRVQKSDGTLLLWGTPEANEEIRRQKELTAR